MNRLQTVTIFLTLIVSLPLQVQAAEYYITLAIDSREELGRLTRVVSIDNVQDRMVHAYANDDQLAALTGLGYRYTLLPHPSTLTSPRMSGEKDALRQWDSYPTYEAYVAMMYQFAANYPDLCRVVSIGYSVQGREILLAQISDNVAVEEPEPEVLYTSSMHGDETAGYILMLRLIDSLLSSYGVDPRVTSMVNDLEIWINPLANPDGTYRSGNHTVSGATRFNFNGVDLNRNFPDPEEGPHPDGRSWQPETIAMMNFADSHNFVIAANFHGGTEVVNYPWDTWPRRHADDVWYQQVSHAYTDSVQAHSPSGYMDGYDDGTTNGWDWYTISGGRQDFMNYWYGCREVTIELSDIKLLSASLLPAHWEYNRVSFLDWLDNARYGIAGIVRDAVTGLPVAATVTVLYHDTDGAQVYTDPAVGDYHRMLQSGIYDLRFTADGYASGKVSSVVAVDGAATPVNVALVPLSSAPLLALAGHGADPVIRGGTTLFNVTLVNQGDSDAGNVISRLSTSDVYATISQDSSNFPLIGAFEDSATALTPFELALSSSCPPGHVILFALDVSADGGYRDTLEFTLIAGQSVDDFESGDFSALAWTAGGNQPWVISIQASRGIYSARSGAIPHNQSSTMQVTLEDLQAGEASFFFKVSSELGRDFLRFYIDDVRQNEWSGEFGWASGSFPVSAGTHTFKWSYSKSPASSQGSDGAWVDNIVFPPPNADPDGDGLLTGADNCPTAFNPTQEDSDSDIVGDSCDNCVDVPNPLQEDTDGDGIGNACEIYVCGDVDGSGDGPNIADLTYLVDYLFNGGSAPPELAAADVNGSGGVPNVADLTYLIDFLFRGGAPPVCG
ncbi:MAG TPA: M14 family zinc carboxypeptidase [Candidatus Deferrimicrobium sp.]|nr:M14 family zinc carboxypeptidase [Candidatus Deferrimicrobium sp.]